MARKLYSPSKLIKLNKLFNIITILIATSSIQCHSYKSGIGAEDQYSAIKYISHIELVNPNNFEISTFEDSVFLYYYKNRIVLKIPSPIVELTEVKDRPEFTLTDSGGTITPHFKYFFYKKEDSLGKMFAYDIIKFDKLNVDSVYDSYIRFPLKIIDKNNNELINSESNNTIETYLAKFKPDMSFADTIKIYYSNSLLSTAFSLSKDLDRKNGYRVSKVEYLYKAYYDSIKNQSIPKFMFSFSIDTVDAKDDLFINSLFKETK